MIYWCGNFVSLKRGLKAKSIGLSKVGPIILDENGVDFTDPFDTAVPTTFHFKHDIVVSLTIVFVGNPDVENISDAISILSFGNFAID